jgi:hypothetical protein
MMLYIVRNITANHAQDLYGNGPDFRAVVDSIPGFASELAFALSGGDPDIVLPVYGNIFKDETATHDTEGGSACLRGCLTCEQMSDEIKELRKWKEDAQSSYNMFKGMLERSE